MVPTPIDDARRPDLRFLLSVSRTVGKRLKRGDVVVYESTVYPGATEKDCVPVLEQSSRACILNGFCGGHRNESVQATRTTGLKRLGRLAAQDDHTLDVVADVYSSVLTAGVYRASKIKTVEAIKVIENTLVGLDSPT